MKHEENAESVFQSPKPWIQHFRKANRMLSASKRFQKLKTQFSCQNYVHCHLYIVFVLCVLRLVISLLFFFYALFRIFLAHCTFLALKSKGKEDYCWNAKLCTHTTKKVKPKNEQYLNKTSNNTHNKLTLFLISEFATLDISIVVIIIMY